MRSLLFTNLNMLGHIVAGYTLKNDLEVRFRMFDWGRLLKRTVNAQVCFRTGNRTKV